jgi:AraC-like DNA-binding protein
VHHISVRYLYKVLSREGVGLGDWIRTERLARCRDDLARSALRDHSIAAIGARWGFADATHFARVFRTAYAISPSDWRRLQQADVKGQPPGRRPDHGDTAQH